MLFFLLALLFSLLGISKVFIIPHCLAFDLNDDANLTFVNLEQWRRVLEQGQWPLMNVFNNFGTPLIGDVTTYPLSPLSLTYAFLPGPAAMTVNRAVVSFCSLFLLFIFYRRRFPRGMSIGLGLCTFYAPGFLWHSMHHHFQMSLLLLTGFLLLQEDFTRKVSTGPYLGLCALSVLMFMSVSLNVSLILCLLIAGYQFFLSGGIKDKRLWVVLSALLCGVVASFPDILLFFQAVSRSIRSLAEYPVFSFEGPNKIFLTPIVACVIYTISLFRERRVPEGAIVLWLGVLPFGIVLFSRVFPFLWQAVPFLGATDVVRLTWGAQIFLMMGCGGLLLRWLRQDQGWRWQVFICLLALGVDAFFLPFRQDCLLGGKLVLAVAWAAVFIAFCFWAKISRWTAGFLGAAVLAFYLYYGFFAVLGFAFPGICHVTGRGAFSLEGSEKFPFPKELRSVPRNSRVAYDFDSILGLDLRGATEGLFGAGARSTIMTNKDFCVTLLNKGLITFDNYTGVYHFIPPWRAQALQELGVSYVVDGKDDQKLTEQGWKETVLYRGVFLYQNPLPAGVVFLKKGGTVTPLPFTVKGNGLNVQLPPHRQAEGQLVISFLRIPGWRVWIDGVETKFPDDGNRFLGLPVSPQDHFVCVRYAPVSGVLIFLCFLAAFIIPWVVVRRAGLCKKTAAISVGK